MNTLQIQPDTIFGLAASGETWYAARVSGLYRSHDHGATWHSAFDSLSSAEPVTASAIAAVGGTLFAGTKGAVLGSTDGAETWQAVGLAAPPPQVTALAVSPNYAADGVVLAGTAEDGIFLSSDRGQSWIPGTSALLDQHVFALAISPDFHSDGVVFAGTESGVYISRNGGHSWRETPFPMSAAPVLCLGLSHDRRLYAGTEDNGLYASDDLGVSWQPLNPEFASGTVNAIQLDGEHVYLLLDDQLACSADGGSTWQPGIQLPPDKAAMTMMRHSSAPDTFVIGCADGTTLSVACAG